MANDNNVVAGWNDIWEKYESPNYFGRRLHRARIKTLAGILRSIKLPPGAGIIDVGCGSGSTLAIFRGLGYANSLGLDAAEGSLAAAARIYGFERDKDVFLSDAKRMPFKDGSFDLVFTQGLLEHYCEKAEAQDIVRELCRISSRYVLLLQPDHRSPFGVVKRIYEKLGGGAWEKEYFYSREDYRSMLKGCGYPIIKTGSCNMGEELWLLAERK
jgi:SAM-dependent methyltransferase